MEKVFTLEKEAISKLIWTTIADTSHGLWGDVSLIFFVCLDYYTITYTQRHYKWFIDRDVYVLNISV